MPTLKAIHICNSHQPSLKPKIAKEYVFANAENQAERKKASRYQLSIRPADRPRLNTLLTDPDYMGKAI